MPDPIKDFTLTDVDDDSLTVFSRGQGIVRLDVGGNMVDVIQAELPGLIRTLAERSTNEQLKADLLAAFDKHEAELKLESDAVAFYAAWGGEAPVHSFFDFIPANQVKWLNVAKRARELNAK